MKVIKKIIKSIGVLLLCAILVFIYAIKIEPYRITVKSHSFGEKNGEIIKVVQISDVQISENYTVEALNKVVEKINRQEPDIFLFTGDLYENYAKYGPEEDVVEALSKIKAVYGKFAVWGNRDYGGGCERRYESILSQAKISILRNTGVTIKTDSGKQIYIAGLDDYLLGYQEMEEITVQMKEDADYRILMTHEPDTADSYADSGFQLILAGHSHGGQVLIPFTKGITTAMAHKYTRGFYKLGQKQQTRLYVNQGIGTSRYPIRFCVPPEIAVFEIGI